MITLAVCDDEMMARKNIVAACRKYFDDKEIECQINEYASGEEFFTGRYPDILVLDVVMKRLNGFFVKEILEKTQADTRIIFVAENTNYMAGAFGKNVYGYLTKPIKYQTFCDKMNAIVEDIQEKYIFCKKENQIEKIYYKNIVYLEAHGRYTKIYTPRADYPVDSDMGICQWEKMPSDYNLVRISKKHMVNMQYILDIKDEVQLVGQIRLPIGEVYKNDFIERYRKGYSK